ncbi:hypothetical protein NSP_38060 [Nodularia spumigena CCY9414]|nr:hypothetical protein NSP_38060 [Nodularia spumigena CCY9414]
MRSLFINSQYHRLFLSWGITTKYLITSDYHMMRARAIATIVFGIQGIAVTLLE